MAGATRGVYYNNCHKQLSGSARWYQSACDKPHTLV